MNAKQKKQAFIAIQSLVRTQDNGGHFLRFSKELLTCANGKDIILLFLCLQISGKSVVCECAAGKRGIRLKEYQQTAKIAYRKAYKLL